MSENVNANPIENAEEVAKTSAEDLDFMEALEESLNNMSTEQKVVGVVTGISPSEIQVDIGRKQTGYVPVDEYSADPTADPMKELKIGDEIKLIIMKTNDQEGTVMLSKKRYDRSCQGERRGRYRYSYRRCQGRRYCNRKRRKSIRSGISCHSFKRRFS